MKRPTLKVCFSARHPEEPGAWLSRQASGFMTVIDVSQSDLDHDKQDHTWLNGNWAARLEIVNRDVLQMEPVTVREWIDAAIQAETTSAGAEALQKFRFAFFGERLEVASVAQPAERDSLKDQDAGSMPAGSAKAKVAKPEDWLKIIRDHGFDDLNDFNHLMASADISTSERLQAFLKWKTEDGTKAGLLKLPSR